MERSTDDLIKQRDILFRGPHEDARQAATAAAILSDVEGVLAARPDEDHTHLLHVRYDISRICLRLLEGLLTELGFHLDNNLYCKLKRALYYYTEDLQQENLGYQPGEGNNTLEVFIRQYQRRPHGCRDGRPDHWRHYL